MNMDYSKAFELLNQDAEKERNKKAEKAVHDNLYNKGFRDGLGVLDKIRAEIEEYKSRQLTLAIGVADLEQGKEIALDYVLAIINKYKAESEDKEYEAKVITRGNCMMCGKELHEGLFFCKECEAKAVQGRK